MWNKPYWINYSKENYIFKEFCEGLYFVAGDFQEVNGQFSLLNSFGVLLLKLPNF